MWKKIKTFLAKFFSHDMIPVEPSLTPVVVVEALEPSPGFSPLDESNPHQGDFLTTNFKLSEFSCNDENKTEVPLKYLHDVSVLAANLQVLRDEISKPIKVNSGYRTPEYNKKVGGVKTSQHLKAKAADIHVKGIIPKRLGDKIKSLIKEGNMAAGGVGIYKNFVHYDIRGVNRRWYGSGVKK